VGPRTGLDAVAKRKSPIIAPHHTKLCEPTLSGASLNPHQNLESLQTDSVWGTGVGN